MKQMFRTVLATAALALGATSLVAQPAIKLVVVDLAKVFDNHYKSEEARTKFQTLEQRYQQQGEELVKQGKLLVDSYQEAVEQAKSALLTPEAKAKAEGEVQRKEQEIRQKQEALQQFQVASRNDLQQRMKNHRDMLLEEITKVVSELAKKQGATLVLDKSGPTLFGVPSVVYADPAYDITEDVIKEVNKDRPPPAPAPAAGTPAPATPPATPSK